MDWTTNTHQREGRKEYFKCSCICRTQLREWRELPQNLILIPSLPSSLPPFSAPLFVSQVSSSWPRVKLLCLSLYHLIDSPNRDQESNTEERRRRRKSFADEEEEDEDWRKEHSKCRERQRINLNHIQERERRVVDTWTWTAHTNFSPSRFMDMCNISIQRESGSLLSVVIEYFKLLSLHWNRKWLWEWMEDREWEEMDMNSGQWSTIFPPFEEEEGDGKRREIRKKCDSQSLCFSNSLDLFFFFFKLQSSTSSLSFFMHLIQADKWANTDHHHHHQQQHKEGIT